MTAFRVFATARPSLTGARVLPMDAEDQQFWKLRREREEQRKRESAR